MIHGYDNFENILTDGIAISWLTYDSIGIIINYIFVDYLGLFELLIIVKR